MGACLLAVAFATSALIPLPEARANHPGPAADRYVAIDNSQRVPSNFLDIKASGTALATGDDAQSEVDFPAGFTFDFYDKLALEKITMNANGVLLAGTSCPGDPCYTPNDLTGASGPAYVMAPFWVDQNSGCATTTATIKHQTFDASAPTRGRIWVIQWSDMSLYGNDGAKCTTPLSTYQVQLFEGTDILEFHLKSVSNRDNSAVALAFCQDASVGIRGATTGLSYVWADGCTNAHGGNPVIANRPIRFWKNDVDAGDQVVETVMGQPVSFSLDASDDPKIFTLVSDVPADVGLLSELPSEGALYYNPFSPVTFTPVPGFAGTTSFRYTVSDGFDAPVCRVALVTFTGGGVVARNLGKAKQIAGLEHRHIERVAILHHAQRGKANGRHGSRLRGLYRATQSGSFRGIHQTGRSRSTLARRSSRETHGRDRSCCTPPANGT